MANILLNRRSFLKGIGITSAGLVLPSFNILFPKNEVNHKFEVRPIVDYDIYSGSEILRYDIFDGEKNLYISTIIEESFKNRDIFIKNIHEPMVSGLKLELIKRKIPPNRLMPLAWPLGYKQPEWLDEIFYG